MNFQTIQKLSKQDMDRINSILIKRLNSDVALINQISAYIINSGGKRLRPLILILLAKALNYDNEKAYLMAVVIELIHTATLLHDDVVDSSQTRRGENTANENFGNEAAVLTGDFLYSRAFEIMVEVDDMAIMQIMAKATNTIAEGEVLQLLNIGQIDIDEQSYLETIEKKTAVLFSAATNVAAILSKNSQQKALINFGINLGNAFQIIDDILDYKSDVITLGKEVGDDLRDGKITLPLIYTLNNTSRENKDFIINNINSANPNISEIINIIDASGGFEYAFNTARQYANIAKENISFIAESEYKQALLALCELSLNRKS